MVHWVNDHILATVGLDKRIKIWNFHNKKLLYSQKVQDFIYNLSYIQKNNTLVFIDTNGQIGFSKGFDFTTLEKTEQQTSLVQPSKPENEVNQTKVPPSVQVNANPNSTQIPTSSSNINEEKKNEEVLIKKAPTKEYFADNWIGSEPQNIVHSSETSLFKSRRFLCWNLIGNIVIRKDHDFNFLDIDFSDKNFHKNIRSRDIYDLQMGDMNYSGAILASKGVQLNENEYEDEIHNDEIKKFSYIQFKGFSYMYEPYDWTIKLQKEENAECVCIGSTWCAVATDYNYIRIFNFVGIETKILSYEKAIVSMAGNIYLIAFIKYS